MNSSAISPSGSTPAECLMRYDFQGEKFDDTFTEAYTVFVFLIVVSIITCPFTILLNALVIAAKQIAAQQVSLEARQKFLKEKKGLKITTTVILILLLSYFPIFVARILLLTSTITSVNVAYICLYTASFVTILNSPSYLLCQNEAFPCSVHRNIAQKKLHTTWTVWKANVRKIERCGTTWTRTRTRRNSKQWPGKSWTVAKVAKYDIPVTQEITVKLEKPFNILK